MTSFSLFIPQHCVLGVGSRSILHMDARCSHPFSLLPSQLQAPREEHLHVSRSFQKGLTAFVDSFCIARLSSKESLWRTDREETHIHPAQATEPRGGERMNIQRELGAAQISETEFIDARSQDLGGKTNIAHLLGGPVSSSWQFSEVRS